MQVDRPTPAIILNADTPIAVQYHVNLIGMTGQSLIYRVVDYLLSKVIGPQRIGIHTGTFAHGF